MINYINFWGIYKNYKKEDYSVRWDKHRELIEKQHAVYADLAELKGIDFKLFKAEYTINDQEGKLETTNLQEFEDKLKEIIKKCLTF